MNITTYNSQLTTHNLTTGDGYGIPDEEHRCVDPDYLHGRWCQRSCERILFLVWMLPLDEPLQP